MLTKYDYDCDWLRTDMSTLKTVLMSEDLPEPFCDQERDRFNLDSTELCTDVLSPLRES